MLVFDLLNLATEFTHKRDAHLFCKHNEIIFFPGLFGALYSLYIHVNLLTDRKIRVAERQEGPCLPTSLKQFPDCVLDFSKLVEQFRKELIEVLSIVTRTVVFNISGDNVHPVD